MGTRVGGADDVDGNGAPREARAGARAQTGYLFMAPGDHGWRSKHGRGEPRAPCVATGGELRVVEVKCARAPKTSATFIATSGVDIGRDQGQN